jgi:hypothetical protein
MTFERISSLLPQRQRVEREREREREDKSFEEIFIEKMIFRGLLSQKKEGQTKKEEIKGGLI